MIQGCLSGGRAAVSRGDLTDTEWRILNPLLPDRGERGPAIADKRRAMRIFGLRLEDGVCAGRSIRSCSLLATRLFLPRVPSPVLGLFPSARWLGIFPSTLWLGVFPSALGHWHRG